MDRFSGTIRRRLKGKLRTTPVKNTIGKDPEPSVSKTSLSRLERLSDDLLLDIIELVAIPRTNFSGHPMQRSLGTIDLLSLMRCNHHMYTLGEPLLYRNLIETSPTRLPRFIRTIIWRPYLAEYVRNVSFKETDHHKYDGPTLVAVLSPADRARIQFLIKSRTTPKNKKNGDRGNFAEGLQNGKWRFMAGFTLSLLPNIEELNIRISLDRQVPLSGRPADALAYVFLRAAELRYRSTTSPNPNPLSKLRDLTISYDSRRICNGIRSLFPYVAHHALQSFTGDQIRGRYSDYFLFDTFLSQPPPELQLKSLRLERSNIITESLQKLLQLCPVLEMLKYEHHQNSGEDNFLPEKFGSSIEHLKPYLRELVLYRPGKYYQSIVCIAEEVTTVSLSGFEKLTHLSITANLLMGALKCPKASTIYQTSHRWIHPPPNQELTRCLPRSLEHLCLKECGEGIIEDVSELVEQAAIVTPNLKTLVLTYEDLERRDYLGNFRRRRATDRLFKMNQSVVKNLEEDCIAKGIELDVLYN